VQTFETFDAGAPPADLGPGDCLDPKLRLRIQKIVTRDGGAKIFCIVSATDGVTSEVAITPLTRDMRDNDEHFFDPSAAIFWGQKELHATTNNLAITFNCFKNRDKGWENALNAMGEAARKAGGIAGPYGWAFGAGAVAADAAAAAVKAAGDQDLVMNAQQIVDRQKLLDLTNGRDWYIRQRRRGSGLFSSGGWDWELRVQSWGCADARGAQR
jgi:hypothetical protein